MNNNITMPTKDLKQLVRERENATINKMVRILKETSALTAHELEELLDYDIELAQITSNLTVMRDAPHTSRYTAIECLSVPQTNAVLKCSQRKVTRRFVEVDENYRPLVNGQTKRFTSYVNEYWIAPR